MSVCLSVGLSVEKNIVHGHVKFFLFCYRVHYHRELTHVKNYLLCRMSTEALQSASVAKNTKGTNADSKKKASPTSKVKTSYATMIIEAIQEL